MQPKTFVITGVSSGLGLALAQELLRRGHRVFGCGRRADPLADKDNKTISQYAYRQLDILDKNALQNWSSEIASNCKGIDFLIHNAAVIHQNAPLWKIEQQELESVINVNILGTFNVLRAFIPNMLKINHGMIITLSSGAGRSGFAEISGYCASKWAVEGLTKSLASELPDGMAAIPLSPGIVDTDMLRSTFGDSASQYQKADAWAEVAADTILSLKPSQSGQSLTVPESD